MAIYSELLTDAEGNHPTLDKDNVTNLSGYQIDKDTAEKIGFLNQSGEDITYEKNFDLYIKSNYVENRQYYQYLLRKSGPGFTIGTFNDTGRWDRWDMQYLCIMNP